MRLKSVELFGFKSFPERTVVTFDDGLTAIIGPNGCGKSNIVDAIKWVLGEKSAKNLRGDEMLDVIFSGCSSRAPSGFAEVTLNFDNSDPRRRLKIDFAEVAVTRRLNRARESEYLINKNPCRLRDIRDLFLDTGVGNSAYSVIEQGRVEALLAARPADRRAIFEEAAGIARFKSQRKETLARLERTEQHLLRARDRLLEKEGLIRKVSAQAANARRHRRLSRERDAVRARLYRRQYAAQTELLEDVRRRREALNSDLDGATASLAGLNLRFIRLREEEEALNGRQDAAAAAAAENQEARSQAQLDMANARNSLKALEDEIARGNERRAELSARLERLSSQEAAAAAGREEAARRADELESLFSGRDRERQDLLRQAGEAENLVTGLRNRFLDANRRRQELSAGLAGLEAAERSEAVRLEEAALRLARLEEAAAGADRAAGAAAEKYRQAADGFGAAARQLEELRGRNRDLSAAVERLRSGEREDETEKAGLVSRRAVLEDLAKSLDGAFEGVRNVLLASRRGDGSCPGVAGMVGELLSAPEHLALAVETVLGASAQDLVVETARDAQAAIEYLKRGRLGRATFLPLDRIQPRRRLDRSLCRLPGAIGEAADLVAYDRRHAPAIEHLLAGVLVVENLELARELSGREARGVKIVTLEGDVVNPSGAMTGGHGRQSRAGLVQRKAELDALERKLAEGGERWADRTRRRGAAEEGQREILERIAAAEREVAELGRSEAGLKQAVAASQGECGRLAGERAAAEEEIRGLSGAGAGRREDLAGVKGGLAGAEAEMAGLELEIEAGVAEQRRSREAAEALGAEFARLSGEKAEAAARRGELEARLRELAEEIASCRESLACPGVSLEQADAETARLRGRLADLEEREAELLRVRDENAAAAAETGGRLTALRSGLEDLRREERDGQTQIERLREGLAQLARQDAESRLRMENIRDKAREELGLPEEALARSGGEAAGPETEAEPGAGAEPDALEAELSRLGDSELQARAEELSQKLRNIGHVNPEAIDELAELEASAEFLRAQKEEQEEAAAVIRAAVEDLNGKSATRFQETFEAVRISFQQIFASLFGGGRADLLLETSEDPEADPLDAGIEIRAQPPGKEPKSISLLSGGEKALCAVALLLALFRSKPSPFCILDEVDGPLDEANIGRFIRQLRDFSSDTQFIIISHSQLTMHQTDVLWGVTQRVAGISNVHGLNLLEMERMSAERPAGRENAGPAPAIREAALASG